MYFITSIGKFIMHESMLNLNDGYLTQDSFEICSFSEKKSVPFNLKHPPK